VQCADILNWKKMIFKSSNTGY